MLARAFTEIHKEKLPFWFKNEINLLKYTTLKSDHKKGISKMPTEPPTYMDLDDIIK